MKNNTLIFAALIIFATLLGVLSYIDYKEKPTVEKVDTVFQTKTDTLWKDTTIYETQIKEKKIVEIKRDTVYTKNGDSIPLITELKEYDKRLIIDKDTADVKIYTSGIKTSLDSLKMRLKTHNEVVTNTIEVTKYVVKKKRFHLTPQLGVGYGLTQRTFDAFFGVGIGIDI